MCGERENSAHPRVAFTHLVGIKEETIRIRRKTTAETLKTIAARIGVATKEKDEGGWGRGRNILR